MTIYMPTDKPIERLTQADALGKLREDPIYKEHQELREQAEITNDDCHEEAYKKYVKWDPISRYGDRDVCELRGRFHPAFEKDGKIFRILGIGVDQLRHAFTWDPKLGEEVRRPCLVNRCITLHWAGGCRLFFQPTIEEVLKQLPPDIVNSDNEFLFTTQAVSTLVSECALGLGRKYHAALTAIYRV